MAMYLPEPDQQIVRPAGVDQPPPARTAVRHKRKTPHNFNDVLRNMRRPEQSH